MSFFSKLKNGFRDDSGTVIMEYIIITTVFLLAVGGLVYYNGSLTNLFPGMMPGNLRSSETIDETLSLVPAGEAPGAEITEYGIAGESFARQTKNAQRLVSMPLP